MKSPVGRHTFCVSSRVLSLSPQIWKVSPSVTMWLAVCAPPVEDSFIVTHETLRLKKRPQGSQAHCARCGPIEPATTAWRPVSSKCWRVASRASCAAAAFSSATRCSALWSFSRGALAPKLLVRMMSAPASRKAPCSHSTSSGFSTHHKSGG